MTAGVSINKLLVSHISGSLVAHQLPSSVVLVPFKHFSFLSSWHCVLLSFLFLPPCYLSFLHSFCWWPLAGTPGCCLWIRPVIRCRPGFGMQDVLVSCGAQRGDEWAEMDTSTRPHQHAHTHTHTHALSHMHRGSTCSGWMAGGVGQLRWVFTLSFEPHGEKFDSHSGNNWSHFLLHWQLHLPAS